MKKKSWGLGELGFKNTLNIFCVCGQEPFYLQPIVIIIVIAFCPLDSYGPLLLIMFFT